MNTYKILFLLLVVILISSLTGCYTQVATSEPYATTTIYEESTESPDYYSEEGELLDSGYYSENEIEGDESVTIINEYSGYPYSYYDTYPYFTIGFGLSWYWGWGGYYSYWPYYYPYSYSCYYPGYYYYDPYYCYYPGYYYDPYYCYGGYYPNYDYGYGYYPRDEYVSRIRNNSGGRNSSYINRDPLTTQTTRSINDEIRNLNSDRDLTVGRNNSTDRNLGLRDKTGNFTRDLVSLTNVDKVKDINRNDKSKDETSSTRVINQNKQIGLDKENQTKRLGNTTINEINDNSVRNKNNVRYSDKINTNNRIGNETKNLFNTERSKQDKNNVRSNNNNKQNNVRNKTHNYQTPKKDNNTRNYTPPKQNNNSPRTYSPPSGNNTPRSYSPPTRNSGSHNSGNRKR